MTLEDSLKDLILSRYHSIREFTTLIDLPYTTLDSMFRRGVENSSIVNVSKVCKALGISMDALANGKIEPIRKSPPNLVNDWIEVDDILDHTKDVLIHHGGVTIDGKPIGVNAVDSIIEAMDLGLALAKKKTKL